MRKRRSNAKFFHMDEMRSDGFLERRSCSQWVSRRTFFGGTALVVFPELCGGCKDAGAVVADLCAVADNAIVIPLEGFPAPSEVGGSIVGKADGHATPIAIASAKARTCWATAALRTRFDVMRGCVPQQLGRHSFRCQFSPPVSAPRVISIPVAL
jgi:hypothetical protein